MAENENAAAVKARGVPETDLAGSEVGRGISTSSTTVQARREYILAELRCAALRARLVLADVDAVGLALKSGFMTPEAAAAALWDTDATWYIGLPRPTTVTDEVAG